MTATMRSPAARATISSLAATATISSTAVADNDTVNGDAGNDIVGGGDGIDIVNGGTGNDFMTGGLEADFFVFDAALVAGNVDRIFDFTVADDTIPARQVHLYRVGGSALPPAAFHIGAAAADASDRIIYNDATGALHLQLRRQRWPMEFAIHSPLSTASSDLS